MPIDKLVAEAIVDCYNESEEVSGLYTMIEGNLAVPFETTVLGVTSPCDASIRPREKRSSQRQRARDCRDPRLTVAVAAANWRGVDRLAPLVGGRVDFSSVPFSASRNCVAWCELVMMGNH